MQLWFARASDVTIREQLVTQIILEIMSEALAPGQRLPKTRELARRFHVHPNTISALLRGGIGGVVGGFAGNGFPPVHGEVVYQKP